MVSVWCGFRAPEEWTRLGVFRNTLLRVLVFGRHHYWRYVTVSQAIEKTVHFHQVDMSIDRWGSTRAGDHQEIPGVVCFAFLFLVFSVIGSIGR